MLKVVDKQLVLLFKQVVIVKTVTTWKEHNLQFIPIFFYYLGSLLWTFMIHKTAREGKG